MKFILLLTFVFTVALCSGSPTENSVSVRRDFDFYENSKLIIQELIANLRNAIQQGVNAITTLSSDLQDFGTQFRHKLEEDVEKYRNRIRDAINNVTSKFDEATSDVRNCIDQHRQEAEGAFTGIITKSKACADDRIKEIGLMIIHLKDLTINATNYVNHSIEEMRNCTQNSMGIFSASTCLGRIAIRTEVKGAIFIAQSGILITRINIALASLPSALEICAATNIVEAGITTAKVVIEIGSCSAMSIFTPQVPVNSTSERVN